MFFYFIILVRLMGRLLKIEDGAVSVQLDVTFVSVNELVLSSYDSLKVKILLQLFFTFFNDLPEELLFFGPLKAF